MLCKRLFIFADTGKDIDVISDLSIDLHIDGYQLFNVILSDLLLSSFLFMLFFVLLIISVELQCGHRNSTPNLAHKVPKRSRKVISSLYWVTNIAKGRESYPYLYT
ncbi:hypothetical protein HMPREF3034_01329 [Prevotella sp. DNF00663]|nr:hypothetical protein HMPREF0671_11225 [Prevotella sp. S7 MS 2]KXB83094.1 hypothetical protein HMPREF3034_01329 [Prevotella sp. DNF00663]